MYLWVIYLQFLSINLFSITFKGSWEHADAMSSFPESWKPSRMSELLFLPWSKVLPSPLTSPLHPIPFPTSALPASSHFSPFYQTITFWKEVKVMFFSSRFWKSEIVSFLLPHLVIVSSSLKLYSLWILKFLLHCLLCHCREVQSHCNIDVLYVSRSFPRKLSVF